MARLATLGLLGLLGARSVRADPDELTGVHWTEHPDAELSASVEAGEGLVRGGPGSGYASDRGTFTLEVAPDGSVRAHDARNLRLGVPARSAADREQVADPLAPPPRPVPRDQEGERPIANPVGPIGVTIATFDVTDWLMRGHGQDPYASAKLRALDDTRDRRAQIGEAHRADQLAHAGRLMQDRIDQLWASVRDPRARKRELFQLWDECAEAGPDAVVKATAAGRAQLERWILERLPAGSPDAFTPAELAELNAHRSSRAALAP